MVLPCFPRSALVRTAQKRGHHSSGEKTQSLIMNIGDISDITLQLESSELNGEKLLGGKFELQTVRG